jgi:drug/metabolite transporter (DMT)-like permease
MRLLLGAPGGRLPVVAVTCIRFWMIAGWSSAMLAGRALTTLGRSADCTGATRPGWLLFLSASAELALYDLVGNLLSTDGLSRTSAVEAEFLLSTMNLFVPVFSLCAGATAGGRTWAGCLLAFAGVAVTAVLDDAAAERRRLSLHAYAGPVALLLASCSYALGRVRLMSHLRAQHDSEALVFGRVAGMAVGSAVVLAIDAACGGPSSGLDLRQLSRQQWGLFMLSTFLSGFLGCVAQFRGQRTLAAPTAQTILALQPVFAACWAAALLAEPLRPELGFGGGLILSGALLATSDPHATMTHASPAAAIASSDAVAPAEDPWLSPGKGRLPVRRGRTDSEGAEGLGTPREVVAACAHPIACPVRRSGGRLGTEWDGPRPRTAESGRASGTEWDGPPPRAAGGGRAGGVRAAPQAAPAASAAAGADS